MEDTLHSCGHRTDSKYNRMASKHNRAAKAWLLLIAAVSIAMASCKKGAGASSGAQSTNAAGDVQSGGAKASGAGGDVRVINIAHTATYIPYDFIDDAGNSDGFEVSLLRSIDDMLPQYTFRFHAVSDDELLIGVESGKYQMGIKGVWMTEERKKKYTFPAEPSAVSVIGIAYRASDKTAIHDIDSFAAFSGKLVPIAPQSAQYAIVTEYNKTHSEHPITLVPSDVFDIADAYTWVLEGRYDAYFDLAVLYKHNVTEEGGAYHTYADKLAYAPYKGIPTWPLFNKKETALAAEYDKAVKTLKENGTYSALSLQYFGEDLLQYMKNE